MLEHPDAMPRSDSGLTVGERELTAAYAACFNECHYCFRAHHDQARTCGISADLFGDLCMYFNHAEMPARMQPVLAFVRRLTVDPPFTGMAETQAVYEVGFSEAGLFDVISVRALYTTLCIAFAKMPGSSGRCTLRT